MDLTHDFTVPAPLDVAWQTFMDLERVGGCFPGATVTEAGEEGFAGTVKVKLGPIALQYAGTGHFVEKDDQAHRAVIEAKGKDKRGNGTAGATVTIQLAEDGSGTRVDVTTDLSVTGKPAQFGRGVMQDVSDKLLGQFIACIEHQFDVAPEPTPEATADRADSTPAPVAPAAAAAASPEPTGGPTTVESAAAASAGTSPPPVTRPAPRPAPRPTAEDSIDLGATVLPVLVRSYGPYVVTAVAAFALGWLIGRR
jgi:carbon monoxide dehydrogenase subunit G